VAEGQVFHGTHKGVEVLCYKGEIRHTLCVALDRYINALLKNEELIGFVVDLTQTESIDSTNLGILARLARSVQREGLPKVTIISDRPSITEILEAVGFDRVFTIVNELEVEWDKLKTIPAITSSEVDVTRLLLEAHRELMGLNDENNRLFKDVVVAFQQELDGAG